MKKNFLIVFYFKFKNAHFWGSPKFFSYFFFRFNFWNSRNTNGKWGGELGTDGQVLDTTAENEHCHFLVTMHCPGQHWISCLTVRTVEFALVRIVFETIKYEKYQSCIQTVVTQRFPRAQLDSHYCLVTSCNIHDLQYFLFLFDCKKSKFSCDCTF